MSGRSHALLHTIGSLLLFLSVQLLPVLSEQCNVVDVRTTAISLALAKLVSDEVAADVLWNRERDLLWTHFSDVEGLP